MIAISQYIVDCFECRGPLNEKELLLANMEAAAEAVGATVLDRHGCVYQPHGITAVCFLAESHIMITTWPEHRYATVEVYLCNPEMDPGQAWEVIKAFLEPERWEVKELWHEMPDPT